MAFWVEDRGWETICEAPEAVPLSVVKEFYANAKTERDGFAIVRGKKVDYRDAAIRKVIRQPPKPTDKEDWAFKSRSEVDLQKILDEITIPGTVWKCRPGSKVLVTFPSTAMSHYARAWNLFVCANILPSSHPHEITVERTILLWALFKGEYLDLGFIIHKNMLRFLKGATTGAIPHASVMIKLCKVVGVTWDDSEQLHLPISSLDHVSNLKLREWRGGHAHPTGLGFSLS